MRHLYLLLISLTTCIASFACLPTWQYYQEFTIQNTTVAITEYQFKFTINTAVLVSAAQMQNDGDDIRFTDPACNNLSYYIESGINSATTVLWVRLPNVPVGNTTFRMYYGNPSATGMSSAENTFHFIDNFDGTSLDAAKWNTGTATPVVSGGTVTLSTVDFQTQNTIRTNGAFPTPVIVEMDVPSASGNQPVLGQIQANTTSNGYGLFANDAIMGLQRFFTVGPCNGPSSIFISQTGHAPSSSWTLLWIGNNITGTVGNTSLNTTNNVYPISSHVNIFTGIQCGYPGSITINSIRVRGYLATPPTIISNSTVPNPDDNNPCTNDFYSLATGITHTPVNVNDNNPCTSDACDPSNGNISHTPNNIDDHNGCTTDACDPTTGIVTHTPVNIDDNNACTSDACDPSNGNISHAPTNINDHNECTTDACDPGTGAVSHTPVNIDDGNNCTGDACNPSTGVISHTLLTIAPVTTPTTCDANTGSITANPAGGKPQYSITVFNSSNQVVNTGNTVNGLAAGNYKLEVVDGSNCKITYLFTIGYSGPPPAIPTFTTFLPGACPGQQDVNLCVANNANVTNYNWTLSPGITGTSATNCIELDFSATYAGGQVCVSATNQCGTSNNACYSLPLLTVKPAKPAAINGDAVVCASSVETYCVTPVTGGASYQWTIGGNGGASSLTFGTGQGTACINVNIPAGYNGNQELKVRAVNCKGQSDERKINIDVLAVPAMPGNITGPATVCKSQLGFYSIGNVAKAASYSWSITNNVWIAGGQGINNLALDFATSTSSSAILSVTADNMCGSSPARTKSIAINTNCRIAQEEITNAIAPGIFPNPTSGRIYLNFNSQENVQLQLTVFDPLGRLVHFENIQTVEGLNETEIDLSLLPTGIYLVKMQGMDPVRVVKE